MFLDIISIGDELLIGHTLNTNAHWIAQQLNAIGFEIRQQTSISDKKEHILRTLNEALKHSEVVLITGGLGPTNDDLTMLVLNEYFEGTVVSNKDVLQDIKKLVLDRGLEMNENNEKQALVPDNCKVIRNMNGTAPGLWFEKEGKIVVAMPGVPHEMEAMITNTVIPQLKKQYDLPEIVHQLIYTQGLSESKLAEILEDWETQLPSEIKLAYLPSPGIVKLRLTSVGDNRKEVQQRIDVEVAKLNLLIPKNIYSANGESLQEVVATLLKKKKATLSTAESCTGGYIAHLITSISGSSDYYLGSVVSYANEVKVNELEVDESLINQYGVVSKEVVEKMAESIRTKFKTDYGIATSGIAGPTGGNDDKPVGTVWIAVASDNGVIAKKYLFGNNRTINIERSAVAALGMLRKVLLGI